MLLTLLLLPRFLQAQQSGLAVAGGQDAGTRDSAEFWTPSPGQLHCALPALRESMTHVTLDSWQDKLIVCEGASCDQLTPTGWQLWRETLHYRKSHTSAITSQGLLLIGGESSSSTTELLPWDGGDSREHFTLRHDMFGHCSIQTGPATIVLTGGEWEDTENLVTEYSHIASWPSSPTYRQLPKLLQKRDAHACGSYSVGDTQMILVTGGTFRHRPSSDTDWLDTTEVFPYTSYPGGEDSWRAASPLPTGRTDLRAAKLGQLLLVSGGVDMEAEGNLDEILAWDSVAETWSVAGRIRTGRYAHGVTEVPLAVVADYCPGRN